MEYVTLDVFTNEPFGGNPLAVVLGADALSTAQMQRIAKEFNYSETTFVMPPRAPDNHAHVRIFTPAVELPFAGHPNVGTAIALAQLERYGLTPRPMTVRFEEALGVVEVALVPDDSDGKLEATVAAPGDFSHGPTFEADEIAEDLGLDRNALMTATHPPLAAGVGLPFLFVEVAAREVLARSWLRGDRPVRRLETEDLNGYYVYCRNSGGDIDDGADISARMFAPNHGIVEDPATGSATASLAALRAHFEAGESEPAWAGLVAQGYDMGRPSLMKARAVTNSAGAIRAYVGGTAVIMMQGT
ncbi:MAG: PhzF family phenazine biosynthesis protein, partial [Pseudomonadota bacterium]